MRLALRELRRRPQRFATATIVLTLLVVLLLFLGGLLDGLYLGSTGALRAQRASVIVYSSDANDSLVRSRIPPDVRATVVSVPGIETVGGLGLALVGATVPGEAEVANAAVIGYEQPPVGVPQPPPDGEAWADRRLETSGVTVGMTIGVGPQQLPLRIRGWVDDTNFLLQGALWVSPPTWRRVLASSRPDAQLPDETFAALVVTGNKPAGTLARDIDAATGGATKSLTKDDAVLSLPGTRQQKSTFNGIIFVTFFVVALVVALFFALLTLERTAIYGVLKALGGSTRTLFTGLLVQAVIVGVVAFALGGLITFGLAAILPAQIPLQLVPARAITTLVGVVVTAVIGGSLSLRRIANVDPATAIGTGT